MSNKNIITPEDRGAAARLKSIYESKKKALNLTQEIVADRMGFSTQGAVSKYLNAGMPLGLKVTKKFAKLLGVSILDIRPELSSLIPADERNISAAKEPTPPLLTKAQVFKHLKNDLDVNTWDNLERPSLPEFNNTSPRTFCVICDDPAHWLDKTMLIIDPDQEPTNNELAVYDLGKSNSIVVGAYVKHGPNIYLTFRNQKYNDIDLKATEFDNSYIGRLIMFIGEGYSR